MPMNIQTLFNDGMLPPPLILNWGVSNLRQELHQAIASPSHQPDTSDEIFYASTQHIHKASILETDVRCKFWEILIVTEWLAIKNWSSPYVDWDLEENSTKKKAWWISKTK